MDEFEEIISKLIKLDKEASGLGKTIDETKYIKLNNKLKQITQNKINFGNFYSNDKCNKTLYELTLSDLANIITQLIIKYKKVKMELIPKTDLFLFKKLMLFYIYRGGDVEYFDRYYW